MNKDKEMVLFDPANFTQNEQPSSSGFKLVNNMSGCTFLLSSILILPYNAGCNNDDSCGRDD